VLGGMERWIWRLYHDDIFLHTYLLCWGVLGMYPRATRVVRIPQMIMMSQMAIVP
jgi:hypothetical protein